MARPLSNHWIGSFAVPDLLSRSAFSFCSAVERTGTHVRVVHLGRSTYHAISGRGDYLTRILEVRQSCPESRHGFSVKILNPLRCFLFALKRFIVYRLLFIVSCFLFLVYCLLFIVCCSLFIIYLSLFVV